MIRNPDHAADLEADGATPVLCDLEHDDPAPHLGSADAIVFAAGAGPGSGAERKRTVDYGGAVKLIEAAEKLGVRALRDGLLDGRGRPGVAPPSRCGPTSRPSTTPTRRSRDSSLDWTIVRPGRLTDEPGVGPRGPGAAARPLRRGAARGRRVGAARGARGGEHRARDVRAARRRRARRRGRQAASKHGGRRRRTPARRAARARPAAVRPRTRSVSNSAPRRSARRQSRNPALLPRVVTEQAVGDEAERVALAPARRRRPRTRARPDRRRCAARTRRRRSRRPPARRCRARPRRRAGSRSTAPSRLQAAASWR